MIVLMHFGDGSYKEIDMGEHDEDTAAEAAREWVESNAWFQAIDEDGNDVGPEERL